MQYALLVYTDDSLLGRLSESEYDSHMRACFAHVDELKQAGRFHGAQQLEPAAAARSVRIRDGRAQVLDGPFAETREMLAGFNLIEADSMEEAVRIAESLPWARFGCIEVRPVRDIAAVRAKVGAA